jgi:hypothetical protein
MYPPGRKLALCDCQCLLQQDEVELLFVSVDGRQVPDQNSEKAAISAHYQLTPRASSTGTVPSQNIYL